MLDIISKLGIEYILVIYILAEKNCLVRFYMWLFFSTFRLLIGLIFIIIDKNVSLDIFFIIIMYILWLIITVLISSSTLKDIKTPNNLNNHKSKRRYVIEITTLTLLLVLKLYAQYTEL